MKESTQFKKIPNLSLLFGYLFILAVMASFAYIQFSSAYNLNLMEKELRDQILRMPLLENDDLEVAVTSFNLLKSNALFTNLDSAFAREGIHENSGDITDLKGLQSALEDLAVLLDLYSSDSYRSQTILFITFMMLSVILSVLLTISEFDQFQKYEKEKNMRIMDRKLIDVLENERNLIAIELHDDVAQKLSVISRHFEASSQADHTELLRRYNSDIIHKIRSMASSLRAPEFEYGSFQKQLEFLMADFSSISDIELNASFVGLTVLELDEEQKLHIYRIIQELLTNCNRHSQASRLTLDIIYNHPKLKVKYKDNGIGIHQVTKEPMTGLGLRSIRYRLNILNADMKMCFEKGQSITISVPVEI